MRSRALRLGRSFRGIVLSVLASPLGGAVACSTSEGAGGGAVDATVPEAKDAAPGAEASAVADAGADVVDATVAVEASAPADAAACEPSILDGASLEGPQDGCIAYGLLPCGLPSTAERAGCIVDLRTCVSLCDAIDAGYFLYCQLSNASCDDAGNLLDAESVVEFVSCNGITGRRPLGLSPQRVTRRTAVGDYFASMAHLESASVRAFRDLGRWLVAFDAPARLSRAARRFAGDERRHARAAARLTRRFGGVLLRPRVRRVPSPTLVELLEDDAVEGCVKETFGALLATWQAERAGDARVRRTLRRIAEDETRHAALAWEILRWGTGRLSPAERRRVQKTLDRALVALESGDPAPVHPAVRQVTGHPAREHERRLARALAALVRQERAAFDRAS